MLDKDDLTKKLQEQIFDFCEWIGQRAFTYPNWQERRESFLNTNWNHYLQNTLSALGDPFAVEENDLKKLVLTYQHHSYSNSLMRVFNGLIKQEFAQGEKLIWTGMIEDLGEKSIKSAGIPGRSTSSHYLLLTEKSLLIKSSNKPLTQRFPIYGLELEPNLSNGLRISEPVLNPDRDDLRNEVFTCNGILNGQDIFGAVHDEEQRFVGYEYTDTFLKMISAFAVASQLLEIKEDLLSGAS